jgi:hypothetical protein
MSAALSFLAAKVRALWHMNQRHHVSETKFLGRVTEIYCNECHLVLWVRP